MNKNQKDYHIKSRIWICTGNDTFLGEGRIDLLKHIGSEGSISKAAKVMGMSYKKAWELVNSMNEQASSPLVCCATGGQRGGGSTLTDAGKRAITVFDSICEASQQQLTEILRNQKL